MHATIPTDPEDAPMAEIEIHHAHDPNDRTGKIVSILVGVLGILLAAVTISAHRAHTAAVIDLAKANDQWAYYQAKKIREHMSGVGKELVQAVGSDSGKVEKALAKFEGDHAKYVADAEGIKEKAERLERDQEQQEARALRFDLGEGLLELGLVLTSLYFLGRQKLFPIAGGVAALIGVLTALSGLTL